MVRKLLKHELFALFRILVWFMGAVLLLGVLARIADALMPSDIQNTYGAGAFFAMSLVIVMHNSAVLALCFAAVLLSLVRFFRSLFTGEGYLTFSLPATPTQLLIAKFLGAFIATAACLVTAFVSELIAMPISDWALFQLLPDLFALMGAYFSSEPLVAVEIVLLIIALIPSELLYLYLVASIGQLFTKGRIPITIALYYGISFALSFFFTIFFLPMIELAFVSVHLVMWLLIAIVAGFDVGSFFFIRFILTRKVNLVV